MHPERIYPMHPVFAVLGRVCIFLGLLRHNWSELGLCWRLAASMGELSFIPLVVSLDFQLNEDDPRLIKIQHLVTQACNCYLDQDDDFARQYCREIKLQIEKLEQGQTNQ